MNSKFYDSKYKDGDIFGRNMGHKCTTRSLMAYKGLCRRGTRRRKADENMEERWVKAEAINTV